jgi:hypothetical protein
MITPDELIGELRKTIAVREKNDAAMLESHQDLALSVRMITARNAQMGNTLNELHRQLSRIGAALEGMLAIALHAQAEGEKFMAEQEARSATSN